MSQLLHTMSEEHKIKIQNLCRVCGNSLKKGKPDRRYKCLNYQSDLSNTFDIAVALDSVDMHPDHFCHSCKNIIYCKKRAVENNREYKIKIT